MQDSNTPAKFQAVWANAAGGSYINTVPISGTGLPNGAASFQLGFPPDCFVAVTAGGAGPFGKDFNGVLNQLTANAQWLTAGGPLYYDATFSGNIGGYPKGAVLQQASNFGLLWISTTDNNTTDPDTGGAGWVSFLVGSFNGRVGAVTLSSADVTGALAAGSLSYAKLATAAAGTVLSNLTGSPASPAANSLVSVFSAMAANLALKEVVVSATGSFSISIPSNAIANSGYCWATGGGAGGGGSTSGVGGGGGGAGGTACGPVTLTPGGSFTGSVGAGGAGGTTGSAGANGGDTTAGSFTAYGGTPGGSGSLSSGGTGGTASGGLLNVQGGAGNDGSPTTNISPWADGGSSFWGGNMRATNGGAGSIGSPGAGGSTRYGAAATANSGTSGIVKLQYWTSS